MCKKGKITMLFDYLRDVKGWGLSFMSRKHKGQK